MKKLLLILSLIIAQPALADDWQLLSLTAASEHNGSDVWSGKFTAINGRHYDASAFYAPTNQPFSAKLVLAKKTDRRLTWLLPLAADAGYQARLYQAEPLFALGGGAVLRLAGHSMVSLRIDNILRLGGALSEQPCYDGFRRQYHCGTGLAWRDYQASDIDRRGRFAVPQIKVKLTHRFSF